MHSVIFLVFLAIAQSTLSETYSDHCRVDDDHYQSHSQSDPYLRRAYLDNDDIRSKLISASIPLPLEYNKNSNINLNSGSRSQPVNLGAYTEWWEVVTERGPNGGRHTYLRVDPLPRVNPYETIKAHIGSDLNRDSNEDVIKRELLLRPGPRSAADGYGYGYGYGRKSLAIDGTARRSKSTTTPEKAQRSLKSPKSSAKPRKNDDDADLQNEPRRKSNENVNTNINQNARRSNTDTRKSSNSNKNVNVNDRTGGLDDNLYELYQKLGRGSLDTDDTVGPKAMAGHNARPIAERSHSNVNHNVNANVNGDMSLGAGLLRPEDLRRSLLNKKRALPRSHHPNDNHNVNININGEEPDDQMDDMADQGGEGEADTASSTAAPPHK